MAQSVSHNQTAQFPECLHSTLNQALALSCGPSHTPVLMAPKIAQPVLQESQSHSALCTHQHIPSGPLRPHHLPAAYKHAFVSQGMVDSPQAQTASAAARHPHCHCPTERIAIAHMQVQLQHSECLLGRVGTEPFD